MSRGLGAFQRAVLERIGRLVVTFGEARVGELAKDLAIERGLMPTFTDSYGNQRRIDIAHQLGLRRVLAGLKRRDLVVRYVDNTVALTDFGAFVVGEVEPYSKEEIAAWASRGADAIRRRTTEAIAAGKLKSAGSLWD